MLGQELNTRLVECMRAHVNVFPWSHVDMPRINPKLACHRLAISKNARPVKYKRKSFNQERYDTINAEVEKHLQVDFILKVNNPEWISNAVLIKKVNGKWRMCIDFTNLNNACPKDSFPLTRIYQLIYSTTRHDLFSWIRFQT